MKRLFIIFCVLLMLCGCSAEPATEQKEETTEEREGVLLQEGEEFQYHDYIVFDGVTFMYFGYENGDYIFGVRNDNAYDVFLSCGAFGIDSSGNYDLIGGPTFCGYKDGAFTYTLHAGDIEGYHLMFLMGQDQAFQKDGYYDIAFCVHPYDPDGSVTFSTEDEYSPIYRLKAE